jgi:hypothetical protein
MFASALFEADFLRVEAFFDPLVSISLSALGSRLRGNDEQNIHFSRFMYGNGSMQVDRVAEIKAGPRGSGITPSRFNDLYRGSRPHARGRGLKLVRRNGRVWLTGAVASTRGGAD